MANKIRGILYSNGSLTYPVTQFRRLGKFENMEYVDKYGYNDYYSYILKNDYAGQAQFDLFPASRETAIMPPATNPFTPLVMHYIRNCARVPLIGEFCNPELVASTSIDVVNDTIQTVSGDPDSIGVISQGRVGCYVGSIPYVTGDAVKVKPTLGGVLPTGLSKSAVYYVIALGNGLIKLATSKVNAKNGVAIDLTDTGTVGLIITVQATENIVNATVLDIPEFTMFLIQYVKCSCLTKERDPALVEAAKFLLQLKQQMIDTLTDAIQDDTSSEIEMDMSAYEDLS